jgi:hypothetical protein
MPKKPNTMKDKEYKKRVFSLICRELGKPSTLVLLEILKDNPDGLSWKQIIMEFLNRGVLPGSYSRLATTMKKFRLCGFISKRRAYTIRLTMALTKRMGKDQRNIIYYLEQPGRNFLFRCQNIVEDITMGIDNKNAGVYDDFTGASEPIDDIEGEL